MKFNSLIKIFKIFFYLLLINTAISPDDLEYKSISYLIDKFNLNFYYDKDNCLLTLKQNEKKIIKIANDSPFIIINDRKYFVDSYTVFKDGQFLLPSNAIKTIDNYFTGKNLFSSIQNKSNIAINNKKLYLNIKTNGNNNDETLIEENSSNDKIRIKNNYIFNYEDNDKPKEIKINAIIIDPGHGGSDPGAIGFNGSQEKDITLKTSLMLYNKLKEKYPDKKIILTRDKDTFVSLEKRSQIANYVFNKYGASLFISIHVNASRSSKSYGFETWILIEEYRRNIVKKGEVTDDKDVEKVLNSMLNDEIYLESKSLAKKVQNSLEKDIGYASLNRGIKEQTYFVIKKSIMPAILVEIGFNTNKYEEIRLTKYEYLNKIAEAISKGMVDFINEFEKSFGFTK
jgi:N-acetylmuramoyl-L-alanine amidase